LLRECRDGAGEEGGEFEKGRREYRKGKGTWKNAEDACRKRQVPIR